MKQSHFYMGIGFIILILLALGSCSPGPVIVKGKKHHLYKGNYRHFAIRAHNKAVRDSIKKANLALWQ